MSIAPIFSGFGSGGVSGGGSGYDGTDTVPASAHVQLLLHFPEADGSTVTADSSAYARTVASSGTFTVQSGAGDFDGSGHLQVADAAGMELGGGDFTLQATIVPNSVSGATFQMFCKGADSSSACYGVLINSSGGIYAFLRQNSTTFVDLATQAGNAYAQNGGFAATIGASHQIAVERAGSVLRIYVDGIMYSKRTGVSLSVRDNTSDHWIGSGQNSGWAAFNGRLDEVRWAVGEALINSDAGYTPGTVPFPDP